MTATPEPVAIVRDVWRGKSTSVEVEVLEVHGQPPDEWASIRALTSPQWCTSLLVSSLVQRYELVTDGPLR